MKAAEEGHDQIVSLLIGKRADLSAANGKGRDALSFAAAPSMNRSTSIPTVRRLIECGANLSHRDSLGMTAKERAKKEKRDEAVACLEEFEAQPR